MPATRIEAADVETFKSAAVDAWEDGAYAVKRAIKSVGRGVDRLEDVKDEASHRIKRHPFTAVGAAMGAGLLLGLSAGWIVGRFGGGPSRAD